MYITTERCNINIHNLCKIVGLHAYSASCQSYELTCKSSNILPQHRLNRQIILVYNVVFNIYHVRVLPR